MVLLLLRVFSILSSLWPRPVPLPYPLPCLASQPPPLLVRCAEQGQPLDQRQQGRGGGHHHGAWCVKLIPLLSFTVILGDLGGNVEGREWDGVVQARMQCGHHHGAWCVFEESSSCFCSWGFDLRTRGAGRDWFGLVCVRWLFDLKLCMVHHSSTHNSN